MSVSRHAVWGTLLVVVGVLFLLDNTQVIDAGEVIRVYWPLLLVVAGFLLVTRRRRERVHETFPDVSEDSSSDRINSSNVFGDVHISSSSDAFKGGEVSTVFGNLTVDLTRGTPAEGEHELVLHGVFGNTHVVLPKSAAFAAWAEVSFGDLQVGPERRNGVSVTHRYKTPDYETASKKIRVTATQVFGKISIGVF